MASRVALGLCLLLAASAPALAAKFTADLTGEKVVPPVTTKTTASFKLESEGSDSFKWTLDIKDGENVTMAHIHFGNSSTNGPVVVVLLPQDGTATFAKPESGASLKYNGTFGPADFTADLKDKTAADLVDEVAADDLYVNVHTTEYPDGVVRGQLVEEGASEGPSVSPSSVPAPSPGTSAGAPSAVLAMLAVVVAAAAVAM